MGPLVGFELRACIRRSSLTIEDDSDHRWHKRGCACQSSVDLDDPDRIKPALIERARVMDAKRGSTRSVARAKVRQQSWEDKLFGLPFDPKHLVATMQFRSANPEVGETIPQRRQPAVRSLANPRHAVVQRQQRHRLGPDRTDDLGRVRGQDVLVLFALAGEDLQEFAQGLRMT